MTKRSGILLGITAVAAVLFALLFQAANARISVLEKELAEERADATQLAPDVRDSDSLETPTDMAVGTANVVTAVPVTPTEPVPIALGDGAVLQSDMTRAANWKAQMYVSEVERLVALTPEQKKILADRYRLAFGLSNRNPREMYRELLQETLGDEVAAQYERAEAQEEQTRHEDQITEEVFSMSRKLALNSEQEKSVREALQAVTDQLKPLDRQLQSAMQEAMSNHSGAQTDKERLRGTYDQVKALLMQKQTAKNEALNARLKEVLTEDQYNALLAQQASNPNRF